MPEQESQSGGGRAPLAPPFKPLQTILEQEIEEAQGELARPATGLFLSGLLAGIGVGYSVLLIASLATRMQEAPEWLLELVMASAYSIGFILVIIGRTDLFTEYTTIAILPVLSRQASLRSLARLWFLVYVGNLIGTAIIALLIVIVGTARGIVDPLAFDKIADSLVAPSGWIIVTGGVLAGWLMGLLSWLVTASRETISQVAMIWIVGAIIGYLHLPHAVTGSAEVLAALFAGETLSLGGYLRFMLYATLGNSLGGIAFAALIHHSALLAAKRVGRGPNKRSASDGNGLNNAKY